MGDGPIHQGTRSPSIIDPVTSEMVIDPLQRYINVGTHPNVADLIVMVRNHHHERPQLDEIRDLAFRAALQEEIRGEKVVGQLGRESKGFLDLAHETYKYGKLRIDARLTGDSLTHWESLHGPARG